MNRVAKFRSVQAYLVACFWLTNGCSTTSVTVREQASEDTASTASASECPVCEHGQCINRQCLCAWGFAGAGCNVCAAGRVGPDCHEGSANVGSSEVELSVAPAAAASVAGGAGVAPLGVFFDAAAMLGMTEVDALHADVRWDFGDSGAGVYATTQKPRDRATGFVAAHVFEKPGSYRVEAVVVDAQGKVRRTPPLTILVQAFVGQSRCLSTGPSFEGAPAGCAQITDTSVAAHLAWVTQAPNRRLLLRRGDEWTLSAQLSLGGTGPTVIGAFGSERSPRPVLHCGGQKRAITFGTSHLRLLDLDIDRGGISLDGQQQVAHGLSVHHAPAAGVTVSGDQVFLSDSSVEKSEYFSIYAEGSRMSFTGNRIDQLRVATAFSKPPSASRDVYIAHNLIDASRPDPTTGIKWHSRRGVITDNILVAGLSRIALTTDSGGELTRVDEGLGVVLVERNLMRPSLQGKRPDNDRFTDAGVSFNTQHHLVIRHNLMVDMSRAFVDSSGSIEPVAQHVAIYNNSIVKRSSKGINHDEGDFLSVGKPPIDWRIFNNIIEATEPQRFVMVKLVGRLSKGDLTGLTIDHNLYYRPGQADGFLGASEEAGLPHSFGGWQKQGFDTHSRFVAPGYASTNPDDRNVLTLRPDSQAIDSGTPVEVPLDGAGLPRRVGKGVDLGAFERVFSP